DVGVRDLEVVRPVLLGFLLVVLVRLFILLPVTALLGERLVLLRLLVRRVVAEDRDERLLGLLELLRLELLDAVVDALADLILAAALGVLLLVESAVEGGALARDALLDLLLPLLLLRLDDVLAGGLLDAAVAHGIREPADLLED